MQSCKCGHRDHEHKQVQQVLWPNDKEPPITYRGELEDVYGTVEII